MSCLYGIFRFLICPALTPKFYYLFAKLKNMSTKLFQKIFFIWSSIFVRLSLRLPSFLSAAFLNIHFLSAYLYNHLIKPFSLINPLFSFFVSYYVMKISQASKCHGICTLIGSICWTSNIFFFLVDFFIPGYFIR